MAENEYTSNLVIAKNEFISNLAAAAGITADDAEKVSNYYRTNYIAKVDAFGKTIGLTHREFWNKDTILNTLVYYCQ